MAIRYTPGQFRDALGLTKQTFRYWKRDLPALAAVCGHSPCFGPGDLLATAVAKHVVDLAALSVSRLAPLASDLFAICHQNAWPQLERFAILLLFESGRVDLVSLDAPLLPSREAAFYVPLPPLIDELRRKLLEAHDEGQRSLAFPPVSVRGRA